ncbi:MAG: diguanylate cyclase domain-containing protein [Cellulomonas sp.]
MLSVVLLVGVVVGSLLDSAAARLVTMLLALGVAFAVGTGLRSPRPVGERRTAGEERDLAAERRDLAAHARDVTAERRDDVAGHRDVAADHRDVDAAQRDHDAKERDRVADERSRSRAVAHLEAERDTAAPRPELQDELNDGSAGRVRALHDRSAGSIGRSAAELDREAALADRGASAGERTNAEHDRDAAMADRDASADERKLASVDTLTGALLRGAGSVELEHELARARRTDQSLALAFIDVDHLKAINDSRGHAAGDLILREVATTLRASLRPYDVVIRYGGDEFVCALPGLDLVAAQARLETVNRALAEAAEPCSVTIGLAELQPGEAVNHLVARADAALLLKRRSRRGTPDRTAE